MAIENPEVAEEILDGGIILVAVCLILANFYVLHKVKSRKEIG